MGNLTEDMIRPEINWLYERSEYPAPQSIMICKTTVEMVEKALTILDDGTEFPFPTGGGGRSGILLLCSGLVRLSLTCKSGSNRPHYA